MVKIGQLTIENKGDLTIDTCYGEVGYSSQEIMLLAKHFKLQPHIFMSDFISILQLESTKPTQFRPYQVLLEELS